VDLGDIGWEEGVDWIHVAQDRDQLWAVVNTVKHLWQWKMRLGTWIVKVFESGPMKTVTSELAKYKLDAVGIQKVSMVLKNVGILPHHNPEDHNLNLYCHENLKSWTTDGVDP